jgi:hypothetical protein
MGRDVGEGAAGGGHLFCSWQSFLTTLMRVTEVIRSSLELLELPAKAASACAETHLRQHYELQLPLPANHRM